MCYDSWWLHNLLPRLLGCGTQLLPVVMTIPSRAQWEKKITDGMSVAHVKKQQCMVLEPTPVMLRGIAS